MGDRGGHQHVGDRDLEHAGPNRTEARLGWPAPPGQANPCALACSASMRHRERSRRASSRLSNGKAPQAKDFTNERVCKHKDDEVEEAKRAKNRNKSKIRARVEHVFAVIKRLWGFTKVRYRGLAKNACRAFMALALANIYLSRHRLMAQVRP